MAQVECGRGKPVQVVCGAPNVVKDMLVIFAPVGSVLPSTGGKLQQAVCSLLPPLSTGASKGCGA
jgi:tRNA-binding EMAP/Myf-like protein